MKKSNDFDAMNPEDFEQQLERQPLRAVPGDWRAGILHAARESSSAQPSTTNRQTTSWWRQLFWPCPQAWAGLAAAWVVILTIGFLSAERTESAAKTGTPASPQEIMVLREQKQMMAALMETFDQPAGEPPKPYVPRPKSEVRLESVMV
jgi:hypothetical protein